MTDNERRIAEFGSIMRSVAPKAEKKQAKPEKTEKKQAKEKK